MIRAAAALVLALAACGGDGGGGDPDGGTDGGPDGGGEDSPDAEVAASPGCGVAGAAGVSSGTIDVGGTERSYLLVVPAGYDASIAHALVYAWHGRGATPAISRQYFGIEAAAGAAALVVYPQGLPVSAQPSDTGWDLSGTGIDVAFYDALHADLRARFCLDERRLFSIGHSFGGYFSNTLACHRGGVGNGRIRAIASIAGGGPTGSCPSDPVPAVIIHGTVDMVVPYAQGTGSRDHWTAANACAATTTAVTDHAPCIAYDGCADPVWWCSHDDATFSGHGWPTWSSPAAWAVFSSLR